MLIEVYVCPTPGCGDYYGSSGMPDMTVKNQHTHGINFEQIPRDQWHSRAQCPACRAAGRQVERVLTRIEWDTHGMKITTGMGAAPVVLASS